MGGKERDDFWVDGIYCHGINELKHELGGANIDKSKKTSSRSMLEWRTRVDRAVIDVKAAMRAGKDGLYWEGADGIYRWIGFQKRRSDPAQKIRVAGTPLIPNPHTNR